MTLEDLLSDYRAEAGLVRNPPGMTVGGVRFSLYWEPSALPAAGSQDEWSVGIIVAPDTLEAVDMDPGATSMGHLDWMYIRRFAWGNVSAPGSLFYDVGQVRAMRKMEELNETIFMVFSPAMGTSCR